MRSGCPTIIFDGACLVQLERTVTFRAWRLVSEIITDITKSCSSGERHSEETAEGAKEKVRWRSAFMPSDQGRASHDLKTSSPWTIKVKVAKYARRPPPSHPPKFRLQICSGSLRATGSLLSLRIPMGALNSVTHGLVSRTGGLVSGQRGKREVGQRLWPEQWQPETRQSCRR